MPVDWTEIMKAIISLLGVGLTGFIAYKTIQVQSLARIAGEAAETAVVVAKDSASAAASDRAGVNNKLDEIHNMTNSQLEKMLERVERAEEAAQRSEATARELRDLLSKRLT